MNAAVITYQYVYNYGAVLQCLALQRALGELGVDAEVLNYCPKDSTPLPFWRGWGIKDGQLLKKIPKRLIQFRHGAAMERAFDEFRTEYFKVSPVCSSVEEVAEVADKYDAIIAGSDQVWHFAKESIYFLEWGKPYSGKRISYAPCCGFAAERTDKEEDIRKWIMNVDSLSVRNQFSYDLIHNLTGRSPEVVADPTLLVDLKDVAREVKLPHSQFILMYTLGNEIQGGHKEVIRSIREQVGNLPVVAVVPSAHQPHLAPWADYVVYEAGPREWLWLIINSSFVYTDSFHGVLLSLKNNQPFLAFYAEKWRAPRMLDLADRYGVGDRVAGNASEASAKMARSYDTSHSMELMRVHAEESRVFLKDALFQHPQPVEV